MIKRNVEAEILTALDRFLAEGHPLPETTDKKVNVAALCRSLGLRASDTQHLFRKEAVKTAINALALNQGLATIGSRAERDAADEMIGRKIAAVQVVSRNDALAASEQAAGREALLEELATALAEAERLRLSNLALRERLRIIEDGGIAPNFDDA